MRVYVCHPYAGDPPNNVERVRTICKSIVERGHLPIAPHLYLPGFLDEATDRELALRFCVELVRCCDALWFYGTEITPGMERELTAAREHGIPIVNRLFPASPCRPLSFLDVETTGLDSAVHAIIEVAVLKVDADTLAVLDSFESKVRPPADAVIDPEATSVNGYSREAWADAPEASQVLPRVLEMLRGSTVAGHNPAFDWAFLTAALRRAGLPRPEVDYHLVDTASLAWPRMVKGEVPSLSLRAICNHYGITNDGEHRAMADAQRAFKAYRCLVGATP
jgi:DNA polymerase III subunit epsilon